MKFNVYPNFKKPITLVKADYSKSGTVSRKNSISDTTKTSGVSSLSNSTTPKQQESTKVGSSHYTDIASEYMHMQTSMFATQFRIEEVRDDFISMQKVRNMLSFIT
jgi:hypothetical protein